jgi:outer membrane receptor protein involved in Fe transport
MAGFLTTSGPVWAQTPASNPPPVTIEKIETVEVIGVTPIHGLGVPIDKISSSVQLINADDLTRSSGAQLSDFLVGNTAGVHGNDAQANPFQPDIQLRGFVGSPLLGASQGIAVYQDGVRMNEPFGDTLQWHLLAPPAAIASVNVMQGSNPLFGLNALGGAISVQTKTGVSHPGHGVAASAGSFGRRWVDMYSGGSRGNLHYFGSGRLLAESGWRDFSSSSMSHLFGRGGWRSGHGTSLDLTLIGGTSDLRGNGASPVQLLEQDREAAFTHPDRTRVDHLGATLAGARILGTSARIDAVLYVRRGAFETFNGDDTDYEPCDEDGPLLCADDEVVIDQSGRMVALPDDPFTATNNTSSTRSTAFGANVQFTSTRQLRGRDNHLLAGISLDAGRARFGSETELARLTDTRGTIGTGILDSDSFVRVKSTTTGIGLYLADYFSVSPRLTINGSARFIRSSVRLRDQLGPGLNGDHDFTRVNPAAGLTYAIRPEVTGFASVSMASRVPTPSELSCADPEDPCRLPNAFVSDPPLEQVVSRTGEAGLRGRRGSVDWSAAVFRAVNVDDLLFISSGALTNEGYFANVGNTLRRGFELQASRRTGPIQWHGAYTFLEATFDTPLIVGNEHHPSAIDGELHVENGDRIPAVPRHSLKGDVSTSFRDLDVGISAQYFSSQFLRGDEANLLDPVDGFATVNVRGRYRLPGNVAVIGQIINLFNRRYATFGLLGEADDVLGDDFDDPRFLSPGAPRAAWVGFQWTM